MTYLRDYWPWLLLGAITGFLLYLRLCPNGATAQAYRKVRRRIAMRWLEEPVRQVPPFGDKRKAA